MINFEATIEHNDKTFESLSHMRYDLFCKKNRIVRSTICILCVGIGTYNFSSWWGIMLTAYGCYLLTSTYSSANHTAHKLSNQIKNSGESFPKSKYVFNDHSLLIFSLQDNKQLQSINYSQILKIGEDNSYIYIFPNQFGGYMISKDALGTKLDSFKNFIIHKTGKTIWSKKPLFAQLLEKFSNRSKKTPTQS